MTRLFLDFDETLFNHEAFVEFVANQLAKQGIDTTRFVSSFNEYHDIQDDKGLLRLYRHRDHVKDKLGLEWGYYSNFMKDAVESQSADFCYPEVHDFLQYVSSLGGDIEVSLLTYGDKEYQTYKTQLCKHIKELPIIIVDEAKGDFLHREFADTNGVLLDDKAPLDLPGSWQHVWVNRSNKTVNGHGAHMNVDVLSLDTLTGTHIN